MSVYNNLIQTRACQELRYNQPSKTQSASSKLVEFNRKITELVRLRKLSSAQQQITAMRNLNLQPNIYSYTPIINGYINEQDWNGACQTFGEMVNSGIMPNAVTYNTLMKYYVNRDDLGRIQQIYAAMVMTGVQPIAATYNLFISFYARRRDIEGAYMVYKTMLESEVDPTLPTFNSLINLCAVCNEFVRAFQTVEQMKKRGVLPNRITAESLIDLHVLRQEFDKAQLLIEEYSLRYAIIEDKGIKYIDLHGCSRGLAYMHVRNKLSELKNNGTAYVIVGQRHHPSKYGDSVSIKDYIIDQIKTLHQNSVCVVDSFNAGRLKITNKNDDQVALLQ